MVSEWSTAPLGQLVDFRTGKLDSNRAVDGGSYPFFTCSQNPLRINDYAFDCDAILLAGNNANGIFHLNRYCGRFNAYQRTYVITPKASAQADISFLFYVLKTLTGRLGAYSQGTATKFLTMTILDPLLVPLPPIATQRAIAHILGTLDDKIELNRKMNETLEALARALFKSWFVDFDPVRAIAEGRQPSGMDAETAKLFPSEFVDSELGEIPKGWTCAPLGDWVTPLSGGTPSKSDASLWGGELPWISPKVMTAIHADQADDFVTPGAIGNGTRFAPRGSTLVMVRGMGLHKEVRVSQARRDVTFNQDVKALVPKGIEPSLLLFSMLNGQEELLGRVESSGHGTGKLPSEILLGHKITLPPVYDQTLLVRVFDSFNDRIEILRKEIHALGSLRDELLPRLLSGEIPVTDADRDMEATA